ncbi:MAG: xanthine dehydrogenase family protein subunit M [Acidimicrobiales bacterium]
MTYLLPTSVESAVEALADRPSMVLAGATDYYPALGGGSVQDDIVDISSLADLRGITHEAEHWRIGSLTTWTAIAQAELPPPFAGLQSAATQVGGAQIQNVASVGGNLCNASPAADGVPPLLTLDAAVEIQSTAGTRVVPLDEFVLANRVTALRPGELVTAVLVPEPPPTAVGSFEKLGARAYLVISIVMVAALADIAADGTIDSARIAVGACSPVARRLTSLEHDLVGMSVEQALEQLITPEHLSALSPIDDVRATAEYRRTVTPTLIARALRACAAQRP